MSTERSRFVAVWVAVSVLGCSEGTGTSSLPSSSATAQSGAEDEAPPRIGSPRGADPTDAAAQRAGDQRDAASDGGTPRRTQHVSEASAIGTLGHVDDFEGGGLGLEMRQDGDGDAPLACRMASVRVAGETSKSRVRSELGLSLQQALQDCMDRLDAPGTLHATLQATDDHDVPHVGARSQSYGTRATDCVEDRLSESISRLSDETDRVKVTYRCERGE